MAKIQRKGTIINTPPIFGATASQKWLRPDLEGSMQTMEAPDADENYWPCPQGANVSLEMGSDGGTDFTFKNNYVDGPKHCNGKYKTTGQSSGKVVIDAQAGTNGNEDNAFDVKIDVQTDSAGEATAHVTGTAMTYKRWGTGLPAGKQDINETGDVTKTDNTSDGSTTYSITIDVVDKKGKPAKLTISWTPMHPC